MAYRPLTDIPISLLTNSSTMASGYVLEAYVTGTTTPATLYSDANGTSAGSSVTLDARGEPTTIKRVWLDTAVNYKLVLKTGAGVEVWTADPVYGAGVPDNVANVKRYGAVGDGVTDDTAAIQSAIDSGFSRVRFPTGTYLANNILLPSSGITLEGDDPYTTIIKNTHASNHTIRTDSGVTANLWVFVKNLTFNMGTNGQSGDAIRLSNCEQYLVENCFITTPPTFATTGNGIYAERTGAGSRGYYGTVRKCFIEKQGRGIYFKGGVGYRMNVSTIEDSVINNNTNEGVLLEQCTRGRVVGCSLELNTDNIEIINSQGCIVENNYFERPDTHNIVLDTAEACVIKNNQLGSAGTVATSTGRAVIVKSGCQFNQIYDNFIVDGWPTYDIEIESGALQTLVRDNITKDRINDWNGSGTQILDNGTQTVLTTPYLTAGGNMFVSFSGQNLMFNGFTTPAGSPARIGETNAGIYAGLGSPETVVTAYRGSIYLRTNGGGGFTFYVKETGDNTNTGWVAK